MRVEHWKIPTVAIGTWAWGDSDQSGLGYFGSGISRAGLEEIACKAQAAGLHLWDTAIVYGMGRAETLLGEVLKRFARGDYQISTKFTPQAAGTGDHPVADMLEQSLARLGTDYVDLYWIHNPADVPRWTRQVIPLLASGKVKHVGVSNHNISEIELANRILGEAGFRIEAVQNHYSLLHRSSERAGILDYCRKQGIPFFAYMVLEQGALSGKYNTENPMPVDSARAATYNALLPQISALVTKLRSMGESMGATASEVAIAWAIAKGVTPIIGVTRPQHVEGLITASQIKLRPEDMAELEAVADTANVSTRGWWEREMVV
jgi:aryl-alcohol dehydrogenase-like predicted oxidoreductase